MLTRKLVANETSNEFLIPRKRKDSEKMKIVVEGHAEPGVMLIYPKNYNFIAHLQKPHVNRIKKTGWYHDKTIFFEIPYLVTFYPDFAPSMVQYWPLSIPSKKVIFRILSFTKGYVPSADIIELEDSIIHEQTHLVEDEPYYLKGDSRQTSMEENEASVEKNVKEKIFQKYGPKSERVLRNAAINAYQLQKKLKTIMSGVLEYWLQLYFIEKYNDYAQFAIKLDESLTGDAYITDLDDIYKNVSFGYNEISNFKLKLLIKN